MSVQEQIKAYIASQPEAKRKDMQALHEAILHIMPSTKLWYLDGKNDEGKIVSNPNIGYGSYSIGYADGTSREFYQIGMSANTAGISIYIMGIDDKNYLKNTFGDTIGKATVSAYCIKFKSLKDINLEILEQAVCDGVQYSSRS